MPRRRVAVALLPPFELSLQVRALRRALGDPRLDQVPPHLTLVPPVNLHPVEVTELRRVLRAQATRSAPLALELGPAETFAPATPTLHLGVSGQLEELSEFRDRIRVEPVDRPDEWPFTPHVTLRESMPEELLDGALAALTGSLGTWSVDRVHLLEQFRDDRGPYWRPVAEEPFGGPDVVGRGGIELVLRTVGLLEPEVEALLAHAVVDAEHPDPAPGDRAPDVVAAGHDTPPQDHALVVSAELPGRPGEPVAAAVGSAAQGSAALASLHVAAAHQGMGIARQVIGRWCVEAARRGADVATAELDVAGGALSEWGFTMLGDMWVRHLGLGRAE